MKAFCFLSFLIVGVVFWGKRDFKERGGKGWIRIREEAE